MGSSRGRPPRVSCDDLVDQLGRVVDQPDRPFCLTEEIAAEVPLGNAGARKRLKRAKDEDERIRGRKVGSGRGGWVWWLVDE